jgi:hypothetical protein
VSPPDWKDRYARRAEDDRLPTTQGARAALALSIGPDGWRWLAAVDHPDAPPWLGEIPAVVIRRQVWIQNYLWDGTQLRWREADNIPPVAQFISSPDDPEAHDARKHTTQWLGDKVPITEPCEDDLPHLITNVGTTIGPAADGAATPKIHAALQQRGLLPGTPIVDAGFLDAELMVGTATNEPCVYGPRSVILGGRSPSGPSRTIRRSKRHGNGKRRTRFRRSMPAAPGSKAPSRAGPGAHACDAPATLASRGHISDTS